MKFTYKSIFASVLAIATVACSKPAIDEMTGAYSAPVDVALEGAVCTVETESTGDFTFITLNISGKENMSVKFASKKFYLVPSIYYLNAMDGIKAGMYVEGESNINGKNITFGSINVEGQALDEDETQWQYHIFSVVETGENTRARFDWTGTLEFEKPAVGAADILFTDTMENGEAATKHTLSLFRENAPAGMLELYTALGSSSIEGTFVSTEYASEPGMLGNYWEFPDWGISGGSYVALEDGTIKFEPGASLTIKLDPATGWYNVETSLGVSFTMDIQAEVLDMAMTINEGGATDESNNPVAGFDRWDVTLSKDGNVVAAFDLVVSAGSPIEGEYVVAGYPHEDHVAGNGWGIAAWNYFGGTRFLEGDTWIYVNPGSVLSVKLNGDGTYTFSSNGANLQSSADGSEPYTGNFKFAGKLS